MENGKINGRQFTLLIILFSIGDSILIVPSGLASEAKQDAWIASIFAVGVGLLLVSLYNILSKLFPQITLVDISEKVLGKWLGKMVSLLYFSFSFYLSAIVLRSIGDFMLIHIMPDTPIQFIHILFLGIVIFGTRLGLEPLARSAEIFFPWVAVLFFILVIFISPHMEFQKIQPILENGIKPILRASIPMIGIPFLELILFLMICPYVNQTKMVGKAFFSGTLIGGIILIIITTLSILVLGADITARNTYPSYVLAKKINIGGFLERIESIMGIIWMLSIYYKVTILFYVSASGLAQSFKLKDYRQLVLPLGMIMLVMSINAYPNWTYFQNFIAQTWTPYALTYGLFLPLLLLGTAYIRKKLL